jgi:hypothetical protein
MTEETRYRWTQITDNAPFAARDGAGALVFKDRMWLLGGWNPNDKAHFPRICNNEVWSSTNGSDWTLVKANTFLDEHFDNAHDWEGRHTAGYAVTKTVCGLSAATSTRAITTLTFGAAKTGHIGLISIRKPPCLGGRARCTTPPSLTTHFG